VTKPIDIEELDRLYGELPEDKALVASAAAVPIIEAWPSASPILRALSAAPLGQLVGMAFREAAIREVGRADQVIAMVRSVWTLLDDYNKRIALSELEVVVAVHAEKVASIDTWRALIEELIPPKAPFTVRYVCDGCGVPDLKLWRGVHGAKDRLGRSLLCAACLAPDVHVDDEGRAPSEFGGWTHQVADWLPAVPVDDTFWGYSSTPTSDVRWWKAIPTYVTKDDKELP
jgi:hypothetical protein